MSTRLATQIEALAVDSDEFLELFKLFAEKIISWKMKNGNELPYWVWRQVIAMAGEYFCVELLILNQAGQLVMKKRTGSRETEWENQLHVPGKAVKLSMEIEQQMVTQALQQLLIDEVLAPESKEKAEQYAKSSYLTHLVFYPEIARQSVAITLVHLVVVDDRDLCSDMFVVENEQHVIVNHQHWCKEKVEASKVKTIVTIAL